MSPFVITTTPGCTCDCCEEDATRLCCDSLKVSRRAVATLEEAARAFVASVMDVPAGVDPLSTMSGQRVMSWDGLAPLRTELPDGTVIEVEMVEWLRLCSDARLGGGHWFIADGDPDAVSTRSARELITGAYNEAQVAS